MSDFEVKPLLRVLGPLGVMFLTLSVLSPGASVLVAGADVLHTAGTGAPLAFLLGGVLTLIFTFSQAELGSAYPLAGGDYAIVGNSLGPRAGFVQFGITLIGSLIFLAICGTGVALYMRALWPGLPFGGTAVGALALASSIAILNIRTGALFTGAFLLVELFALALLAVLGFGHATQSAVQIFTHPLSFAGGSGSPLSLSALALAIAAGSWATSGAGQAIYFSEEMHEPKHIGRLVIVIVVITVFCEFVPVLGVIVGTDHLSSVLESESPFNAFLAERASPVFATIVTICVIAALFNACISVLSCYGRFIYSSGRDRIWPGSLNRLLSTVHGRFGSPWVATLCLAATAAACCFISLPLLIILASGFQIVTWMMLNLGVIARRRRGTTGVPGTFRTPLFPLMNVLSLAASAALAFSAWEDVAAGRPGMLVVIATIALSLAYYELVLVKRRGGWTMFSGVRTAETS
ncbi:MAG: APC family permease [Gemmatimonadaceae bacterium]|nr:APC family permease [Gemmatimonadaceae bacterium]